MASKFRALGVHIFAGGFSIGVEKHFKLLGHLERSNFAVASWQKYRPRVPVHVDRKALWTEAVTALRGKVDWVYGNPPCSPWSQASIGAGHSAKSGKQTPRGAASPLMDWTCDVARVGAEVGAKVVAIESVRGALRNGASFYDALWREYRSVWAGMMWVLVNPVCHGLPQNRPRVFVVFAPEVFKLAPEYRPPPTILEAIAGAPPDRPMTPKEIYCPGHGVTREDIFACVGLLKPGQGFSKLTPDEVATVAPMAAQKLREIRYPAHLPYRLRDDRPCPVVFGHAKFVHPVEPRLLTLRELMRLTGYPDDFEFVAKQPAMGQLGKTVCPPAGAWLAREVAAYFRGDRACRGGGQVVLDCSEGRSSPARQMTFEDM